MSRWSTVVRRQHPLIGSAPSVPLCTRDQPRRIAFQRSIPYCTTAYRLEAMRSPGDRGRVCTIGQTPRMETRNVWDHAQKPRPHRRRDGAPRGVKETTQRPTNHGCGGKAVRSPDRVSTAQPPRSSPKSPHRDFGSTDRSRQPRRRVRARVTTLLSKTDK